MVRRKRKKRGRRRSHGEHVDYENDEMMKR